MPKIVQFSVGLDNSAGTLARLCAMLHHAGVNIEAISVSDNTDCGWVRLIATPAERAREALAKARYTVCAQLVLALSLENEPGALGKLAARLAKAGVNINYVYGSTPPGEDSTLILGVSDVDAAMEALGDTVDARRAAGSIAGHALRAAGKRRVKRTPKRIIRKRS